MLRLDVGALEQKIDSGQAIAAEIHEYDLAEVSRGVTYAAFIVSERRDALPREPASHCQIPAFRPRAVEKNHRGMPADRRRKNQRSTERDTPVVKLHLLLPNSRRGAGNLPRMTTCLARA